MDRKTKSMRNIMRKSESDVHRFVRSSSGGSGCGGSLSHRQYGSSHDIFIEKKMVKQVKLGKPKRKENEDGTGEPVPVMITQGVQAKLSNRSLKSAASKPSQINVKDENEEVELPVEVLKDKASKQTFKRTTSPTSPFDDHKEECDFIDEVEGRVDPEILLTAYFDEVNEGYWEHEKGKRQRKPPSAFRQRQPSRQYSQHNERQRQTSPFLPSTHYKIPGYARPRPVHINSPRNNPNRRVGPPKDSSTNLANRVACAKRMTVMDLKCKIKILQDEIEKLKKENRFLNHLHHRQDNALKKWEGKDAELPRLLNQHKDEIRALQQQLRRSQQVTRETNDKLGIRDKKILRLETEVDKLRSLVQEEHLQDRHQLQEELDITRMNLTGAEKRIREYMKHVDILEKNHRHQLTAQERKLIKVNNNTYELQQLVANLRLALRNKDRMLNYIQMRSSGRNLIRAFHAEKAGKDDILFGTRIASDLNRAYPDLEVTKAGTIVSTKAESFTSTPTQDIDAVDFNNNELAVQESSSLKTDYDDIKETRAENMELSLRPLSRGSRSLDSMIGLPTEPGQRLKPLVKNHRPAKASVGAASLNPIKGEVHRIEMKVNKSPDTQQKIRAQKPKTPPKVKVANTVSNRPVDKSIAHVVSKPPPAPSNTSIVKTSKEISKPAKNESRTLPVKNISTQKLKETKSKTVRGQKSKELIYSGKTTGFKYEGPFVSNSKKKLKENAEMVYTSKSEKSKSRSSGDQSSSESSTSCSYSRSSRTASSTRSEILSNIDILSARIRESCVLVPPPEEKLNSPRHSHSPSPRLENSQPGAPHPFPSYVQHVSSPVISLSPRNDYQNYQAQSPGVMQILANETGQFGTIPSPRERPNQYVQVLTPSSPQLTSPRSPHFLTQAGASQPIENIYSGPAPNALNYGSFSTVSFLPNQQNYGSQQNLPRFAPYYSYAATQGAQQPNVSIVSTENMYDPNTRSAYSQQNTFYSPNSNSATHSTTLPPVSFPPASAGRSKQTLPSVSNKNSGSNKPGYDPSYYVNLSSWK